MHLYIVSALDIARDLPCSRFACFLFQCTVLNICTSEMDASTERPLGVKTVGIKPHDCDIYQRVQFRPRLTLSFMGT